MTQTLTMKTEAPTTLNFLIYIQNSYLNAQQKLQQPKFPLHNGSLQFHEQFEAAFSTLWQQLVQQVIQPDCHEMRIFHEEKQLFYEALFVKNDNSYRAFLELHEAFHVWWSSFAGGMAIERAVDERMEKLYSELVAYTVNEDIPIQHTFGIHIVYDEIVLAQQIATPYYATVSIPDFYMQYDWLLATIKERF